MPPPVLDNFGRLVSEQPPDLWPARSGIAMAICKMAPHLPQEEIETLFSFLVPKALGDRNTEVRTLMREAALATINDHGKVRVNYRLLLLNLLPFIVIGSAGIWLFSRI